MKKEDKKPAMMINCFWTMACSLIIKMLGAGAFGMLVEQVVVLGSNHAIRPADNLRPALGALTHMMGIYNASNMGNFTALNRLNDDCRRVPVLSGLFFDGYGNFPRNWA